MATRVRAAAGASSGPDPPVGRGEPTDVGHSTARRVSELQQALGETKDTVTNFLAALTGELVVADVVRRLSTTATEADVDLGISVGSPISHRLAVLRGNVSGRAYLFASTAFSSACLPESVCARLEHTCEPIGRVLEAHGAEMARRPLAGPQRFDVPVPGAFAVLAAKVVWSRSYRLTVDGRPGFAVREWFLGSVLEALDRPGQTRA
jgi:chorismate-pyruvate lyase